MKWVGELMKSGTSWLLTGILLALFFLLYSTLSFQSYKNDIPLFNSPDETANYYFSKQFALSSTLVYSEPLLKTSNGYVHPRSMTAVGDFVAPVGFLGLPVMYGFLGKIFGVGAIPFFTPLIASITALFFYILIRNMYSVPIAIVSMILLLIHPAYVYNANRAMLPNVLFVDLLIIGLALASCVLRIKKRTYSCIVAIVAGLAIGASLWVRFSESPWVLGLLCMCWLIYVRKIHIRIVVAFLIGMTVPLSLMALFNASVYGNPLLFGYQTPVIPQAVFQIERSGSLLPLLMNGDFMGMYQQALPILRALKHAVLPFGIQTEMYQKTFFDYGVYFFYPFSILALFGFFFSFREALVQLFLKRNGTRFAWIVGIVVASAWLIVFYGSWVFYDNLNREVTIGTSYLRYWLPIFIFAIPYSAKLLVFLFQCARGIVTKTLVTSIIGVLALFSFFHTFTNSSESINAIGAELTTYHAKQEFIMHKTPKNAIIVSARSDKIFFPSRRVAEQTFDFREIELMKGVIDQVHVYYYGLWSQQDATYMSKKYFQPVGLALEFVADADTKEHLYKLVELH